MENARRVAPSARWIASALFFLYVLAAGRVFAPVPVSRIAPAPAIPARSVTTSLPAPAIGRIGDRLASRRPAKPASPIGSRAIVDVVPAAAQILPAALPVDDVAEPLESIARVPVLQAPASPLTAGILAETPVPAVSNRRRLVPLYVTFGTLQALDYHSTQRALSTGAGREANPLARSIVGNRPTLIAAKTAATALVITAGEKMRKRHPVGAVVFVASLNVAMAAIVAHNYSVR